MQPPAQHKKGCIFMSRKMGSLEELHDRLEELTERVDNINTFIWQRDQGVKNQQRNTEDRLKKLEAQLPGPGWHPAYKLILTDSSELGAALAALEVALERVRRITG